MSRDLFQNRFLIPSARATWPEMYEFMFTMLPLQDKFSDILPVLEEKFASYKLAMGC